VLLYFHGGGFTIGSIATHDILCRELAALGRCAWCPWATGCARAPVPGRGDDSLGRAALAGPLARGARAGRADGGGRRQRRRHAGHRLRRARARRRASAGAAVAVLSGHRAAAGPASHRRYDHGLVLEQAHIEYFFGHYIDDWADATTGASPR
jgi:acetyl esterase